MSTDGQAHYAVTLNSAQMLAGFQELREGFSKLGEKALEMGTAIGISFASFQGIEGIAEAFKGVVEQGKALATMASATGEGIQNLVVLQKAFEETGVGADQVQRRLTMLQAALGGVNADGEPTNAIFMRLGLSLQQLKGESAFQQLEQISGAISRLGTQSEKTAAIGKIFGRESSDMLSLLGNPAALEEAKKQAGEVGGIYQRNAIIFSEVANAFGDLSEKMRGLWAGIAEGLAPAVLPILNALKSVDFTGFGEAIGGIISTITAAFKSGDLGELVWLSFEYGVNKFVNALSGTVTGFFSAMGAGWNAEFEAIAGFFSHLDKVWDAAKFGLISAFQAAGAVLLEIFQKPIIMMQAGLEYAMQGAINKFLPLLHKIGLAKGINVSHESFQDIYKQHEKEGATMFGFNSGDLAGKADENAAKAKVAFQDLYKAMDVEQSIKNIVLAWNEGLSKGMNALRTDDIAKQLQAKIAELQKLIPKPEEAAKKNTGATSIGAGFHPGIMSDNLARIGAFVGRGGPAGSRHDADTARHTGDSARTLHAIHDTLQTGGLKTGGLTTGGSF